MDYRPFTYAALFELALGCKLSPGRSLSSGVHKHGQIGFGGREPAFVPGGIPAFRMDILHAVFVRPSLRLGGGTS